MESTPETILVTCPTHECKDYAFECYQSAYRNLIPPRGTMLTQMMIDTTLDNGEYAQRLLNAGVKTVERFPANKFSGGAVPYLVTRVWEEVLIPKAWELEVDWIFHLESDVIIPYDGLRKIFATAVIYDADIVSSSYMGRETDVLLNQSIGCILWKRKLFPPGHSFWDNAEKFIFEQGFEMGLKIIQMTNIIDLQHLNDGSTNGPKCACGHPHM